MINILNGQGIDWVWSTKFLLELEQGEGINFFNYCDGGTYANAKNFPIPFTMTSWDNFYSHFENEKIVIVNSFPNYKNTLDEIDSFYDQLEKLHEKWVILVWFMHFNTLAYINRMPKILRGCNTLDYIFTFDKDSHFARIIKQYMPWKVSSLREFQLPYQVRYEHTVRFEKEDKCVYMWRYATFKNPENMLQLVVPEIKFEYHGCSRTIETKAWLLSKPWTIYRNKCDVDVPEMVNVRWIYKNAQWMEIMSHAKFWYSGFKLPWHNYGNRFEYAMCELIDNQCICIFTKHFLDNVHLDGKNLSSYNAFIWFDFDNPADTIAEMQTFLYDDSKRLERIQAQYDILNRLHDPVRIKNDIFSQIQNKAGNQISTQDLYIHIIGEYNPVRAIEPTDLKRKEKRVYEKVGTKLRKVTI